MGRMVLVLGWHMWFHYRRAKVSIPSEKEDEPKTSRGAER
jgi:hypothetical protein